MNIPTQLKNKNLWQCGLLINGKWLEDDRLTTPVTNPATGAVIAAVSNATAIDLTEALDSAKSAFLKWKKTTVKQRAKLLMAWHDLILANLDDLALILTLEQGKSLAEAKNEIIYGASYLSWYAEEAKRINGHTIAANNPQQRVWVNYEPVGVCAAITPWNFPSAMLARKIGPALAAGCSILAKPASQTPLSANALGYLAILAGIPAGVFNLLHGHSGVIGEFLCGHNTIRKLSFTGSTEVGIYLYQQCANSMKKLSLELGGNAPLIVCADANLDAAVDGIILSKFRNSGQTCICSNRILVHESIKQPLLAKLHLRLQQLKLANGLELGCDLGPLIDAKAVIHAKSLIEDALRHGAKLLYGGDVDLALGPLFFKPTLVECPTINLRLFNEEIFAPILAVYSFVDDNQAIELANITNYGLASYVFTSDISRVYTFSEQLEYGMVGVNTGIISAENVPFGGIKMSGIGREGGYWGLDEYLVSKYICLNLEG